MKSLQSRPAPFRLPGAPRLRLHKPSQLVQVRDSTPFKSIADAAKAAGNASAFGSSTYSVTTQYFEARGRLRLGENVLSQRSLLQRKDMTVTTLWQEQADWGMPPVARR